MFLRSLVILAFVGVTEMAFSQTTNNYPLRDIQAAYLHSFAKYIKWPIEFKEFIIGIYGDEELMQSFKNVLHGKKIMGKPLILKRIEADEKFDQYQIIFFSQRLMKKIPVVTESTLNKNILLVTEADSVKKNVAISFYIDDDKLRFKLKKSVLTQSGLVASEGLLKLATLQ